MDGINALLSTCATGAGLAFFILTLAWSLGAIAARIYSAVRP